MGKSRFIQNKVTENLAYILSIAMFTFTFFVFAPLEIYFSNINDFWFLFQDVFLISIVTGICVFALAVLLFFILPLKLSKWYSVGLFSIGFALYLQGNYLQIDYGILDGRTIDWSQYHTWGVINTLLWFALILISFVIFRTKNKMYKRISLFISSLVMGIQCVTLLTLLVITPTHKAEFYLSEKNELQISKNKNVVILLLDTFDSRWMGSILEDSPEYKQKFNNFIYYPNMTSLYPLTAGSVPQILTGNLYLNEKTIADHLDWAYENAPLFPALQKNNYEISLYTSSSLVGTAVTEYADNAILESPKVLSYSDLGIKLYRISAMRYFPHILKQSVWMSTTDFEALKDVENKNYPSYDMDNDIKFFNILKNEGFQADLEKNSFKFYHCYGAHQPFNRNRNLEKQEDWNDPIEHSGGALLIAEELIQKIKDAGIYDQTMIIVMADHGYMNKRENPLFMIKPWDSHHEFEVSDVPASYKKFVPMLIEALEGNKGNNHFLSVLETNGDQFREFYNYAWEAPKPNSYFQDITKLLIYPDGRMISTDEIYTSRGLKIREPISYSLGTEINFSGVDNSSYFVYGLSNAEDTHTWMEGNEALFKVDLQTVPKKDLVLEMNLFPFKGSSSEKELIIYANEHFIQKLEVSESGTYDIIIPESVFEDATLSIKFQFPNAQSPNEVSTSNDIRLLAIALKSLNIYEKIEHV